MPWLDNLDTEVEQADFFTLSADALVVPTQADLTAYGHISRHVFKTHREEIEAARAAALSSRPARRLELGDAVSVPCPTGSPFAYRHLVLVAIWEHQNEYTENLFFRAFISALRQCLELRLTSLVFPIMAYDGHLREFMAGVNVC